MKVNKTAAATLAALATQIIFGFSFMFTKIALDKASPMIVIANRYIIAFLGLSLVALFTHRKPKMDKNIWKVVLMAVFQPVLYFVFETYGVDLTNSAFSSVMIALTPVAGMIVGIFALKEIPKPLQYLFMLLSVAGVALLSYAGKEAGVVTLPGVLCLLAAMLSSTVYVVMSRKLASAYSAFDRTWVMAFVGMVVFAVAALIENHDAPTNIFAPFVHAEYTLSLLYLGIVSSVVAFLCLNYASGYLTVAKTTVFVSVNTAVSVMAGIVFLDEPFSPTTLFATLMIMVGVFGVQVSGGEKCKNNGKKSYNF